MRLWREPSLADCWFPWWSRFTWFLPRTSGSIARKKDPFRRCLPDEKSRLVCAPVFRPRGRADKRRIGDSIACPGGGGSVLPRRVTASAGSPAAAGFAFDFEHTANGVNSVDCRLPEGSVDQRC